MALKRTIFARLRDDLVIVLTIQYGQGVQFGFESRTASQHSELTAPPVGDIFAGDVTIEGVLLQHDLLGAIFTDYEEGRIALATTCACAASASTTRLLLAILKVHHRLARLESQLVIEFDCNERNKQRGKLFSKTQAQSVQAAN